MKLTRIRNLIASLLTAAAIATTVGAATPAAAANPTNPYCSTTAVRQLIAAEFSEAPQFVQWANTRLKVEVRVNDSASAQAWANGSTISLSKWCPTQSRTLGKYTALHEAAHILDFWALASRIPAPYPAGVTIDPNRETSEVVPVSTWRWGGAPVTVKEYGKTKTIARVEWFADCVVASLTQGQVLGGYTKCFSQTDRNVVFGIAAGSYRTDVVWQVGTHQAFAYDQTRQVYIGQWFIV